MMLSSKNIVATVFVVSVFGYRPRALQYIPEHARGGAIAQHHPELLPPKASPNVGARFIDVPLDHFDDRNTESFPLRYYVDTSCWDAENGVIFVEMGGEGPAGGIGGCSALAQKHHAMNVAVEHLYYGESIPNNDRTVSNLKYLTVEQNLADTAFLVEAIQKNLSKRHVVVNFGGSYSGATAAWFRIKYPQVTHAASSSSGVVNAILNFTGFDEVVAAAIDRPVPGCADRLRAVTKAMETGFADGKADIVKKLMNAPNLVGTPMGDNDFWYMAADAAAMADQYGNKKVLCEALDVPYANGATPTWDEIIENFSTFVAHFWGKDFAASCFYDSECIKNTSRLVQCGLSHDVWPNVGHND